MTDPIEEALRRELRGHSVSYDPQRADEMIGAATAARPRTWVAPVAAAATVVVVGGGVAYFGLHGSSHARDAAGPGSGCPSATGWWGAGPPSTYRGTYLPLPSVSGTLSGGVLYGSASAGSLEPDPAGSPADTSATGATDSASAPSGTSATDTPSAPDASFSGTAPAPARSVALDSCATDLPSATRVRPFAVRSFTVPVGSSAVYTLGILPAGRHPSALFVDTPDRVEFTDYLGTTEYGNGSSNGGLSSVGIISMTSDGKQSVRVKLACVAADDGTCDGTIEVSTT